MKTGAQELQRPPGCGSGCSPGAGCLQLRWRRYAELDKLLSEANTELDPQKRVDLTYQADQMIWEEGHSVTLYQRPDLVASKKTLVNFGALGYADIDYSIIGFKS